MTQGRNAVVTGSTSGIGLGIAEALAAAGMNVMLNGFGDADQIQTHRLRIAETHGVETDYSDADMTVPRGDRRDGREDASQVRDGRCRRQ